LARTPELASLLLMRRQDGTPAGDDTAALYKIHAPRDILRPFVRRLLAADADLPEETVVRVAPTGYNYMGWRARGRSRALIDGESTDYSEFYFAGQLRGQRLEVVYSGHLTNVIAEFTATGLLRLMHVPGSAVLGGPTPVAKVSPDCARVLSRLPSLAAGAAQARVNVFQDVLCGLVDEAEPPIEHLEQAVSMIESASGRVRIAELCRTLGVSQRHLARTFTDVVGIGPKHFAKVVQLSTTLGALLSRDREQIASVAHDFGYSDHAHFVHVMGELLRMGPTTFLDSHDDVLATFLARSQAPPADGA
jgi:AraC-like DNA-binding protein